VYFLYQVLSHKAHRAVLIFVSLALSLVSQTSVYTARPRIQG